LDSSCRCSRVMSRMAGMWKRRVKVWGFLGAKMLSRAMRQYSRARALSQRSSSLEAQRSSASSADLRSVWEKP